MLTDTELDKLTDDLRNGAEQAPDHHQEQEQQQDQEQEQERPEGIDPSEVAPAGSPLFDLTAFRRDLLITIESLEPINGADLFEAIVDAYAVTPTDSLRTRIYRNLSILEGKGFLQQKEGDSARSKRYALTRRGKRELDEHCKWAQEGFVPDATAADAGGDEHDHDHEHDHRHSDADALAH